MKIDTEKEAFRAAVHASIVQILQEKPELFRGIIEEAVEDALFGSILQDSDTGKFASYDKVMKALDKA